MTWIMDTKSPRHLSAKLMAGLAISALLAIGTFAAPANADQQNLPNYGGYYGAPPVAYGSSYGYGYAQPYGYGSAQPYGYGYGSAQPYGYVQPYGYGTFEPYGHNGQPSVNYGR